MAHNLMHNSRFYSLRDIPWHGFGYVSPEPLDAIAAADKAGVSALKTFAAPVWVRGHAGYIAAGGYKALLGCMVGEHKGGEVVQNGETKTVWTYGVVKSDYEPIFHHDALTINHQATNGAPVETIGLLGNGETLFITYKLPSTSVKGDELANYLLLMNPLDGVTAVTARTTAVRVVCQNTLSMALGGHTESQFRSIHSKGVSNRLMLWLADVWAKQGQAIATLQEAYTTLANRDCTPVTLRDGVLSLVYPYPDKPVSTDTPLLEAWEQTCLKQAAHRNVITQLFEDSPTNTSATKGTLWGAYNAVVEYEDHARNRTTAHSRVLGTGAQRKAKAFDACMSLIG